MSFAGPVLSRLRAATAAAHTRLEEAVGALERLSSPTDRRALVLRYYEMHASADGELTGWLGDTPGLDLAARRRTPGLLGDMGVLNLVPPPADLLPSVKLASRAEALGFLYVLEGSTLGGRVIGKALKAKGQDLTGLSFLDPYGEAAGERWRGFAFVLEREAAGDVEGAVRGALAGFAHARACLAPAEAAA